MISLANKLLGFYRKKYNLENRIPGNSKIRFYDKLSNETYEERIKILCQYIEYWELHNGEKSMGDNLSGYSKIINGKYVFDVLNKIYDTDKNLWEKLIKKIKTKNITSEQLKNITDSISTKSVWR